MVAKLSSGVKSGRLAIRGPVAGSETAKVCPQENDVKVPFIKAFSTRSDEFLSCGKDQRLTLGVEGLVRREEELPRRHTTAGILRPILCDSPSD